MKLERTGRDAFTLGVSAAELSSLIAAVRVAADVLEADQRTRPGRPHGYGRLLAITSGRQQGSPADSPGPAPG
jgi:hypothetical protein